MRLIIDGLIALMLLAVLAGVLMLNHDRKQAERDAVAVQDALERLREQAAYHNAVQSAMAGHDTLLVHLERDWFAGDVPTNALVPGDHPWIDLAPPGDTGDHPPDPIVTRPDQAEFWFNPTTGVFRARVSPQPNEAKTLELYNQVNGTALLAFEQIPDPARRPIAHEPGVTPVTQYASMAHQLWSQPEPDAKTIDDEVFKPLINRPEPDERPAAVAGDDDPSLDIVPDNPAVIHDVAEPANATPHVPPADATDAGRYEDETDPSVPEPAEPTADPPAGRRTLSR